MKKQTPAEAGKKGGFIRWAKVSKKKRSDTMRKVAQARWKKEILKRGAQDFANRFTEVMKDL